MKTVKKMAAQGDVLVRRIDKLPQGVTEQAPDNGALVVAHSETGHHHAVDATGCKLYQGSDPLVAYLMVESVDFADLVHHRTFDTHETLRLCAPPGSIWEVRRQREEAPEGWRRVLD